MVNGEWKKSIILVEVFWHEIYVYKIEPETSQDIERNPHSLSYP